MLASLTAGALGLTIGTSVKPQQIGLIFGVVVMPITFLGCVYYPWAALTHIRWLQIGVLVNPIVYMSEGLRAALTPSCRTCRPVSDSEHAVRFVLPADVAGNAGISAPGDRLARNA